MLLVGPDAPCVTRAEHEAAQRMHVAVAQEREQRRDDHRASLANIRALHTGPHWCTNPLGGCQYYHGLAMCPTRAALPDEEPTP